ncbi:MAG: beta-lactamase family protein [Chitinophagaceae bacterium]|nr:beta-lactamase family protein [Chitinophagaceae bacterium]
MKKNVVFFFSLLIIQQVYSQQSLPVSTPEAQGFSSERLRRIDKNVQEWISKNWMNSALVLITRNGKVIYNKAYGYDDTEKKTALKNDQLFRLASQTKAITSVGIMTLFEEAKLMLDDSVAKFIPEFANIQVVDKFNEADSTYSTVKAERSVTIRDLLTHTSGIGYPQIGSKTANAIYAKNNITAGIAEVDGKTIGEAMRKLGSLPLMHQPGKNWTYGLNSDLLGYVIEVVSGQKLDAFLKAHIFDPLGMKDTWFYLPKEKQNRLTTLTMEDDNGVHPMNENYKFNGRAMKPNYPAEPGTYFSGGAGLTASITDYAIFLQMLLNGGTYNGKTILSPNSVRMMTSNQIGNLDFGNEKFGLGFSITTEQSAANLPVSVGNFSWGGAFGTTYWVDPKEKIVAQLYTQIWGRRHSVEDAFKVLVYQAMLH